MCKRHGAENYTDICRHYDDEYLEDDEYDDGYAPGERELIARQEAEEEEAAHADVFDRQDMGASRLTGPFHTDLPFPTRHLPWDGGRRVDELTVQPNSNPAWTRP